MKNEENRVFSETEKTVIFIHEAVHLVIDGSVTLKIVNYKP